MNIIIRFLFLIIVGRGLNHQAHGQTMASNTSLAEKIYLQLDKDLYTSGSTIWFKSIVTKSIDHTPTDLSGVLYVELINNEESLIEKKRIKLDQGIGQGHFDLPETLISGTYLIRAYTVWNKNFDNVFFYEKYIQVFSLSEKDNLDQAISQVTLVKEATGHTHLRALINPYVLDSLHKKELQLYITLDNKKDSVYIQKEKNGGYQIDYKIPQEGQVATLELITSNQKKYAKTIALDDHVIDLQFFPESGELVHGLATKVAFKAVDAFGSGIPVAGAIVDLNNDHITSFKSNRLGMGTFELNQVDSNQTYYAKWVQDSSKTEMLYPLPKIASLGNILSITEIDKNIWVNAQSNYLTNDSIYLNVSFRGVTLYDLKARLKNSSLKFLFSSNDLPEGIIVFKMMDSTKQAVAERLFFNKKLGKNLNIKIAADRPSYSKRDLTTISIEITNTKGEAKNSNTSVLVINKEQLGEIQNTRENILSYLLMSSELMGPIEKPGFYFNNNKDMSSDLDALMLTQGWRVYKYSKPFGGLPFKPERSLTVSGHISSTLSKNKRRPADITMMTFGENKDVYAQTTDSLGNFQFDLFDEFGKEMGIVLQSAKKSGKKMNYNFILNREQSPTIVFNHKKSVEKLDSIANIFLKKEDERQLVYDDFSINSDNILLEEVIIDAYKLTPNRKKVMDRFGTPDEVIDGEAVAAQEKKWSFGLYSVLMFSFSDKLMIKRGTDGNLYPRVFNGVPTLVIVDGIIVRSYELQYVQSIPPSEVSSVEIIEYAKNFPTYHCEVYPESCLDPPRSGNIIAIYTYGQQGLYGVKSPKGIMKTTVPVFSQPKEFYAPKYNLVQPEDLLKPDLRNVIHWQPILKTDVFGKATTSFYNADIAGDMMVVVEAINENGDIGYLEYSFSVE